MRHYWVSCPESGSIKEALMTESRNVNEIFETLAKIMLRCFVLGYCLLLFWIVLQLCAGDKLFRLTPHEVELINYCGIAFVKCVVLLFFLFPYVAIRLVLRKRT
jgi:hypothetical protein